MAHRNVGIKKSVSKDNRYYKIRTKSSNGRGNSGELGKINC
jgi:hypothetical protein